MRLVLHATDLPGRTWADHSDIHVALQVGKQPDSAVPGDALAASWETEVRLCGRAPIAWEVSGQPSRGTPGA